MNMKIQQKKLLDTIGIFRPLVDEIKLVFKPDGLHMSATDPASNHMVLFTLKKEAFDEYKTEDLEIGIVIDKLYNFLRLYKKADMFAFEYDPDTNKLIARVGNLTRTFGLIDTAGLPDPKIPKLTFTKKAIVNSDLLIKTIKGVIPNKKYIEPVNFWATSEGLHLSYVDDDQNNSAVISKEHLPEFFSNDNRHSRYDSSYLLSMLKEIKKLFPDITLEFAFVNPIHITSDNKEAIIDYWLAPRIEEAEIEEHNKSIPKEQPAEVKSEPETQKVKAEPEIKEVIEPLISNLEYGSTDILFYKKEVFVTGDTEHIDKEDLIVNVQILLEIFNKYSKKIQKLVGVHKDYDKDYVCLLVNGSKKYNDLAQGVKVFSNTTAKGYYETKQRYDSKKWLTFDEFLGRDKQDIKPENEVKEPDLSEKPPLEEQISVEKPEVAAEKLQFEIQKRPMEPIVAVQKTEIETRNYYKDIGWLASPKNDFYLVGEIVAVTKTGYLILFRGSKKYKEPVEMDRDLVEVYRKE